MMNDTTAATPVACTLSSAERQAAERHYAKAGQHYRATATLDGAEASVRLHGDMRQLTEILDDMRAREAGCCAWLAIDVAPLADASGMHVRLRANAITDTDVAPTAVREMLRVLFPTATLTAHS